MLSKTWHSSPERFALLLKAVSAASLDGLYLEFGVADGTTINLIAKHVRGTIHGFDSFLGLPESWRGLIEAGTWSTNGKLPDVLPNVRLHPGSFRETLPQFAESHSEPAAFMHVDCDLYSSAKTVFEYMGPIVVPGTVIVFDQYYNFPGSEQYEYKVFQEFIAETGFSYRYLKRAGPNGFSAAVIIG
jgi:methyltransferase family protein